ncbi:oxygenase MpaB family protein [Sphingomonas radiodurans]|uniref:oxygenase MpaB family protein n=1 Tax=Sphingomonas radiodurans TaxID=2890321 RepID=UPI001E40CAC9|nr:oxygenase MpaB family protein [Sphingomonas radiodurans]WBH15429.1 oxygenase MpaB family protein [Sphingomonas radiodurans]
MASLLPDLRAALGGRIRALVGSGEIDLSRPPGDDGLFGPGSAAWRIHGDFSAMMIGGVSALLLQMLHPLALAGIWDHSDFRRDRLGRLRRTAQFISVTTFGSTTAAEGAIGRVRSIHNHVSGALPDGTRYDANDPALLTWVHVAEVDSFLRGYLRYRDPAVTGAEQDRYFAETATIARRLGARDVPETRREVEAYYRAVRPELRFDARTQEVANALLATGPDPTNGAALAIIAPAGLDLLPPWAAAMHGRAPSALARPAVRLGARGMSNVLRWALARR